MRENSEKYANAEELRAARYAEALRELTVAVETRIGAKISPLIGASDLIGRWMHAFVGFPGIDLGQVGLGEAELWIFSGDGRLTGPSSVLPGAPSSRWSIDDDWFTEHYWVPPMPYIGENEPIWGADSYHIGRADDGRIVLWNEDASVVRTLTPVE